MDICSILYFFRFFRLYSLFHRSLCKYFLYSYQLTEKLGHDFIFDVESCKSPVGMGVDDLLDRLESCDTIYSLFLHAS